MNIENYKNLTLEVLIEDSEFHTVYVEYYLEKTYRGGVAMSYRYNELNKNMHDWSIGDYISFADTRFLNFKTFTELWNLTVDDIVKYHKQDAILKLKSFMVTF